MFGYEIINTPKHFKIEKRVIDEIFKKIDSIVKKTQSGKLNIIFVNNDEIQRLNKNYRNLDEVTDVLSFCYSSDFSRMLEYDIAGEIVFCEEKIISQATEYGLGEEKEFYKLLIHSILHILGYDHEADKDYEIMQSLEDKIWQEIFEKK